MSRNSRTISPLAVVGLSLLAATGMSAQTRTDAPPPSSVTRLITLGTRAGPIPALWRAQSSNLLIVRDTNYVIDTGPGVMRRLLRAKVDFRKIDTIFITHGHNDHTAGLGELLTVIYSYARTKPVNIYGPPGTSSFVTAQLRALKFDSDIRISDGTRSIPIAEIFIGHDLPTGGKVFEDSNIKVSAVENTHFHFPPNTPAFGIYRSYSYRIETPDKTVLFTGDTGPSDAVTNLARGADILLSEVNSADEVKAARIADGQWASWSLAEQNDFMRHMTEEHPVPEEVAKMATGAGVRKVILTHLPASRDPHDDYRRLADEVRKTYSGEVVVAEDLKEF